MSGGIEQHCSPSPSIDRVVRELAPEHQQIIRRRYERILPILFVLMRLRDILNRNRTWPGSVTAEKGASTWISAKNLRVAYDVIDAFAIRHSEDAEVLQRLFYAYCRYGPISLIDALPADDLRLIPEELQACADFHRLAKHPRSNAGTYIREHLDAYADRLGYARLSPFMARYAYATDRRMERWYVGEHKAVEFTSKAIRRLNLALDYPHRCWDFVCMPLPVHCRLNLRHSFMMQPWLCWFIDTATSTIMGLHLSSAQPTIHDLFLCLRWSIWHYNAPWWPARGAPDNIRFPSALGGLSADHAQALRYLRCRAVQHDDDVTSAHAIYPLDIQGWIERLRYEVDVWEQRTVRELFFQMLDDAHDVCVQANAASVPMALQQAGVSLPWSDGIAAASMLPSGGLQSVQHGIVTFCGIPFDAASCGLADDSLVDVRYDPWDARTAWLIVGGAHIHRAPACAFEHHAVWYDLVDRPESLSSRQASPETEGIYDKQEENYRS